MNRTRSRQMSWRAKGFSSVKLAWALENLAGLLLVALVLLLGYYLLNNRTELQTHLSQATPAIPEQPPQSLTVSGVSAAQVDALYQQVADNEQRKSAEKVAAEKARLAKIEAQRAEAARQQVEQERREKEKLEREKTEQLAREKAEKAKLAEEKRAKEKREEETIKKAKLEKTELAKAQKEQAEKAKLAKEKLEKEAVAKAEKDKIGKEKSKKEQLAKTRAEKEKTEKIAREAEARAAAKKRLGEELAATKSAQQAKLRDATLSRHQQLVVEAVENNWVLPPQLPTGLSVKLQVKTALSGEVLTANIVKSSGNVVFDQSALEAVERASPLPLPAQAEWASAFSDFTFNFSPR